MMAALSLVALLRVTDAIAAVESGNRDDAIGDGGLALGAYQFQAGTWELVSQQLTGKGVKTYDYASSTSRGPARLYALHLAGWLYQRLKPRLGRTPTAGEIYAAWNLGLGGFARRGFDLTRCPAATRDAAARVENLFAVYQTKPETRERTRP